MLQNDENFNYVDLAAGAGGQYRYLKMLRDPYAMTRVGRVGLLRSPRNKFISDDRKQHGWDECTEDINKGRQGDWLHLCWNTVSMR